MTEIELTEWSQAVTSANTERIKCEKKIEILTKALGEAKGVIDEYVEATIGPSQFSTRLSYSNELAHKWIKDYTHLTEIKDME